MHRGGLGVSDAFTRRCLPDILARFGESEPNTLARRVVRTGSQIEGWRS
jgi:hypothetical protein